MPSGSASNRPPCNFRYPHFGDLKTAGRAIRFAAEGLVEKFIKHFRRDSLGVWICINDAEVHLPQGRIQVTVGSRFAKGTKSMNVDLAELLEQEHERTLGRPG